MLTPPKLNLLQDLISGATREELIWLNGYLAGVVAGQSGVAASGQGGGIVANGTDPAPASAAPAAPSVGKITIAYGTETGNSKKLATDFAARAKKRGINAKLVGLEQYRLNDLAKEEYFFTVISTQGDGEPPAAAKKFYDHIHQGGVQLERLKYGVLALGDTSYPLFCKAGEDVDEQLQKMGGQRIVSLAKCDIDYETQAGHWFDEVLGRLIPASPASSPVHGPAAAPRHTGRKFYQGTVLTAVNLNDRGSNKQTYHLEIAAEGVDYQPGDSLGIVPGNPAAVVEAILSLTGIDPSRKLVHRNEEFTVADLLKKKLNIIYLQERVVRKYAALVKQDIPETKIGLLDLLKIYPVKDATQFQEVVGLLEPIPPRLYSISSSPEAHGGEIHLTVARDTFCVNGETRYGLCSDTLAQLAPDDQLEFYIHHNSQFKLPAPDKDIILIGPGTGVAPFRSFLAERDSTGAAGKNWLFFGDRNFTTDFLYQTEIQNWAQTGVLTRINTAFSRDQEEKVYVQHRMRKHAAELFQWLESGAYVYVCGTKHPMSLDVEETLLDIIRDQGNRSAAQAAGYLEELKEAGRYLKDVY
ncbi:MAG TPA: flavodoxin domain-containing protein [Puia sp.]|jgi:sulfite reductase (NADPH) flavoprotein alpha-component